MPGSRRPAAAPVRCCGEAGREQRGTRVRFMLQLRWRAACWQVRYRAYGCPYTLATCEWLAHAAGERWPGASLGGSG